MQCMDRKRRKQKAMEERDAKAFNIILWFILYTFYQNFGYGNVRLQRIFDATLSTMYEEVDNTVAGVELEAWAENHGLTEKDFRRRYNAK